MQMGEGAFHQKKLNEIPAIVAERWFFADGFLKWFLAGVVPGAVLGDMLGSSACATCKDKMCAVALVQEAAICASNRISQKEQMDTCDAFIGTQLAVELVKECKMSRTLSRKRPGEEHDESQTSKKKHVAGKTAGSHLG
jgi:hypothetical protein